MSEFSSEARSLPELADFLDPPPHRDLSLPHVSDLIRIAMMGKDDGIDDRVEGIMAMGRIWEWVVRADVRRMCHAEGFVHMSPFTLTVDGVIGSLDGGAYRVSADPGPMTPVAVLETKLRFSRPFDDIRDYRRYMLQDKAYCHLLGVTEVWMPILHIGNRPPMAEYWWYKLRFTKIEIEENWRLLMNIKKDMEQNG